jgi:hypothetical protein
VEVVGQRREQLRKQQVTTRIRIAVTVCIHLNTCATWNSWWWLESSLVRNQPRDFLFPNPGARRPCVGSNFKKILVNNAYTVTAVTTTNGNNHKNNSNKNHKKRTVPKMKQRLRERRCSEASLPWPNFNSDLLCEHSQLQRCSSGKSARARRKLLDKQAWKILKKTLSRLHETRISLGGVLELYSGGGNVSQK